MEDRGRVRRPVIELAPTAEPATKGRAMASEERESGDVEEQRRHFVKREGSDEESEVDEQARRARREDSDDEESEVEEQRRRSI